MPTPPRPKLSPLEKLLFILKVFRTLSNGLLAFLTAPFQRSTRAAKLSNHVKIALIRSFTRIASVRDLQWLAPGLDEAYPAYAKQHNFPPLDITLPDGTKAYWLGDPKAEKVLIWFHGGGYTLPPDPAHLSFTSTLTTPTLSVLLLAYTLAPHATYPTQLREAVSLLRQLIHHPELPLRRRASSISLGGDSAGGNLALGVLSHLLHPHPEIPALDLGTREDAREGRDNKEKLRAAVLVAPWASFSHDWASVRENARRDVVGTWQNDEWSGLFLGRGGKRDAYNEPMSLGEGDPWFDGVEGVVGEVFVTVGGGEVLRSSVEALVGRLRKVHSKVEFVVGKDEWHDMPFVDALGGGGKQADAMKAFVGRL